MLELWASLSQEVQALAVNRTTIVRRAAAAAEREARSPGRSRLRRLVREDRNDPNEQAWRWSRLAAYRLGAGDGRGCTGAFEHALVVLPGVTDPLVRADVLAGYARFLGLTEDVERARLLANQARAIPVEDAITRCRVLLAWGTCYTDREAGFQALTQARDLAVALDAGQELAVSHALLGLSMERRGRILEREPMLRAGLRYVAAHGLRGGTEAVLEYQLAGLLLDLGRWDEANEILGALDGRGTSGIARYFTIGYASRLAAARGSKDLGTLVTQCRALADAIPQQPLPLGIAVLAAAEAALWAGQPRRGEALAREAWAHLGLDPGWRAEALVVLARAWAELAAPGPSGRHPAPADLMSHCVDLARPDHPRVHAFVLNAWAEFHRGEGRATSTSGARWSRWARALDPYRLACARASRVGVAQVAHGPCAGGIPAWASRAGGYRPWRVPPSNGRGRPRAIRPTATRWRQPSHDRFGLTPRELEVLPSSPPA